MENINLSETVEPHIETIVPENKNLNKDKKNHLIIPIAKDINNKSAIGSLIYNALNTSLGVAKVMTKSVGKVQKTIKTHLKESSTYDHIERPKRWWEFVLLFSILTGIEFIHAVEAIFVNPILLAIGIPATFATMIWSFSPILGLITVPILGSVSDKCSSKMGRRRPFIIYFSVGMVIGMILIAFGPNFSVLLGDSELKDVKHSSSTTTASSIDSNSTIASIAQTTSVILEGGNQKISKNQSSYKYLLIFICLGVIIMDYSADSGSSPAMSYMLDITLSEQHTLGLTIGTAMTAIGGLLGYLMGSLDWERIWPSRVLRNQFQIVFIIALGLFIVMAVLTLTSFKEMPLYKIKVNKAEYARRMSISRSLFYASDRSFKRRYMPSRSQSKSISFGMEGIHDDISHFNSNKSDNKFRKMRASLPNLNNKLLLKPIDLNFLKFSKIRKESPSQHLVPALPTIYVTDLSENQSNNGTKLKESSSNVMSSNNANNFSGTLGKKGGTRHKTSITDIMSKSKFQEIILNPEIDQIRFDHARPTILKNKVNGKLTKPSKTVVMNGNDSAKERSIQNKLDTTSQISNKKMDKSPLNDLRKHSSSHNLEQILEDNPIVLSPSSGIPMQKEENRIEKEIDDKITRIHDINEEVDDDDMSLKDYLISIFHLPRIISVLCLTHLLCWMAFLSFASYFSDFVGQSVYKGNPTASPGSLENILYEQGVRYSCIGMFLYALTCLFYSMRIKRFAERIGTKRVYMFGIAFYCVCMAILGFAPYRPSVIVLSPAAGILQATLLSLPFIFISVYHDKQTFMNPPKKKVREHFWQFWRPIKDEPKVSICSLEFIKRMFKSQNQLNLKTEVPKNLNSGDTQVVDKKIQISKKIRRRGLGTDIAIVSSMVFWAQLVVSLTIGRIIDDLKSTLVIPFYGCILSFLALLVSTGITSID